MFSLFGLFGRSAALKALDHALREAGLHPLVVPEAVKLTILRLHRQEAAARSGARDADHGEAARLLAYCILGRDQFVASNSLQEADQAERRLDAAIAAGDSPDAKLILLALHAGLIALEIAERLEVDQG